MSSPTPTHGLQTIPPFVPCQAGEIGSATAGVTAKTVAGVSKQLEMAKGGTVDLVKNTGSALGSRLHGNRLVAAQKLILAGAYVESGVIVHGPSRDILRAWASTELAAEAGFHTFIMGLARGISKAGVASALTMLSVDGIPQRVASYLPRHGVREYRHLQRAVWVWHREAP